MVNRRLRQIEQRLAGLGRYCRECGSDPDGRFREPVKFVLADEDTPRKSCGTCGRALWFTLNLGEGDLDTV